MLIILSATVAPNSLCNSTHPYFDFRVPFSTIEVTGVCSTPIDGKDLAWILLTIHEYIDVRLRTKGDGTLAPKHDPFGFSTAPARISFKAQSEPERLLTWSVLQTAVEGLYFCLPQALQYYGATFRIRDYENNFQWGHGQISAVPLDPSGIGIQTSTIIAIGNDTILTNGTENFASQGVPVA